MRSSTKLSLIGGYLKAGDHLCSFYESKTEQFQIVLPLVKEGLDNGERCLYVADENTVAEVKAGLLMHGVDVGRYLRSRQLNVVTKRQAYLRLGRFDPDAMISFLDAAVNEALNGGYSAFRGAGEMTWILEDLRSLDHFWEYEAMLNAAFKDRPTRFLCQYNAKRFFGDMIVRVLRTHPRVLLGLDLYENPFYEPVAPPLGMVNP